MPIHLEPDIFPQLMGVALQYRAEIDGLRAVAIVPVLLFHAGISAVPGGFIGVDVFFVISGYLITTIIKQEIDAEAFKLMNFYERRVRRILPALYFMMFLSIPAAYYIFVPYQIKDLSQSYVATVAFLSNYFFYLETDYFNNFTNISPLLHTWTLAVEEQFYVIFPLLMIVGYRIGRRPLAFILVAMLCASLFSAIYLSEVNPILSFYSTHTRVWELIAGALAALGRNRISRSKEAVPGAVLSGLVLISLVSIIGCVATFSATTPTPSIPTLIPVCATIIILSLSSPTQLASRLLSNPIAVHIGRLSYSLYIFHQPVNSFMRFSEFGERSHHTLAFVISSLSITIMLSVLSYYCVERPIRYSKRIGRVFLFLGAGACGFVLLLIGYLGNSTDGLRDHMTRKYDAAGNVLLVDVDAEKQAVSQIAQGAYQENRGAFGDPHSARILIIGDSMANDTFLSLVRLRETDPSRHYAVRALGIDDECMKTFRNDLEQGREDNSPCRPRPVMPEVDLKAARTMVRSADIIILTAIWQETTYRDASELAAYLGTISAARIYVVGTMLFNDTTSMSLRLAKLGIKPQQAGGLMYSSLRFDRIRISDRLRHLVQANPRLRWIEKKDHLCNMQQKSCSVFYEDGSAMIRDGAHLTVRAFPEFGAFLAREVGLFN